MKLTDTEKREILKLIEADKPLPDKYRFMLFDDKREVELVWNGKTSEVTNIVLPFQVDEPRSSKPLMDANKRESENLKKLLAIIRVHSRLRISCLIIDAVEKWLRFTYFMERSNGSPCRTLCRWKSDLKVLQDS